MTTGIELFQKRPAYRSGKPLLRRWLSDRRAIWLGSVLVLFLAGIAIFGPMAMAFDFLSQDITAINQAPNAVHWLGTDDLGRDVLSRVVYGARTALFIALGVSFAALLVGGALGAIAGYLGGRIDAALMWFADMTMSVPSLLLVVVINTSLRPRVAAFMDDMYLKTLNPIFRETVWADLSLLIICLTLVQWPGYARLVRAQVLSIRNRDYVKAAKSLGLAPGKIIWKYVLPNSVGPVIVAVSAGLGTAMVLESAFSFLGVGVQPPIPSWGRMIADGLRAWRSHPHLLIVPSIALGFASIAFSTLGDGLNSYLNPKRRRFDG